MYFWPYLGSFKFPFIHIGTKHMITISVNKLISRLVSKRILKWNPIVKSIAAK